MTTEEKKKTRSLKDGCVMIDGPQSQWVEMSRGHRHTQGSSGINKDGFKMHI